VLHTRAEPPAGDSFIAPPTGVDDSLETIQPIMELGFLVWIVGPSLDFSSRQPRPPLQDAEMAPAASTQPTGRQDGLQPAGRYFGPPQGHVR